MGFGGISIWQLVIVLGIIVLLFGTKKLRNIGGDLGGAIKGFKKAMKEEPEADKTIEKKDAEFTSSESTATKQENTSEQK